MLHMAVQNAFQCCIRFTPLQKTHDFQGGVEKIFPFKDYSSNSNSVKERFLKSKFLDQKKILGTHRIFYRRRIFYEDPKILEKSAKNAIFCEFRQTISNHIGREKQNWHQILLGIDQTCSNCPLVTIL